MPPCTQPGVVITPGLSSDRTQLFSGVKKKVFHQCIKPRIEEETLLYTVDVFLELLELFADDAKQYNGMRVYFASFLKSSDDPVPVPSDKEEKLTLVFVPTLAVSGQAAGGKDDLDNIHTICENKLISLPNPASAPAGGNTAGNWISHYHKNRIPQLEADGKVFTKKNDFQETRSIWYSMPSIKGHDADPGLIGFIKCMMGPTTAPNDRVDGVIVRFACYGESDTFPHYQLTLVFDLHQVKDGVISIGTPAGHRDVPTDTGLPCPPDTSCQGAGFPTFP